MLYSLDHSAIIYLIGLAVVVHWQQLVQSCQLPISKCKLKIYQQDTRPSCMSTSQILAIRGTWYRHIVKVHVWYPPFYFNSRTNEWQRQEHILFWYLSVHKWRIMIRQQGICKHEVHRNNEKSEGRNKDTANYPGSKVGLLILLGTLTVWQWIPEKVQSMSQNTLLITCITPWFLP